MTDQGDDNGTDARVNKDGSISRDVDILARKYKIARLEFENLAAQLEAKVQNLDRKTEEIAKDESRFKEYSHMQFRMIAAVGAVILILVGVGGYFGVSQTGEILSDLDLAIRELNNSEAQTEQYVAAIKNHTESIRQSMDHISKLIPKE